MKKDDYIGATISLLSEGKDFDDVIKNLKKVLDRKGHNKLYKSILEGLLNKIEASTETGTATVSVAREKDLKRLKKEIQEGLSKIKSEHFEPVIDPALIGGYTIEHDNKIIDKSYKSRLVTLYRSLIE